MKAQDTEEWQHALLDVVTKAIAMREPLRYAYTIDRNAHLVSRRDAIEDSPFQWICGDFHQNVSEDHAEVHDVEFSWNRTDHSHRVY